MVGNAGFDSAHPHPFRHQHLEGCGIWLLLFIATPAVVKVGGRSVAIQANHGLLFGPEDPQDYGSNGRTYRDHWIYFVGEAVPDLLLQLGLPRAKPFPLIDPPAVERLFRDLCREHRRQAPYHRVVGGALLIHLLGAIARDLASAHYLPHQADLLDLREEMKRTLDQPWSLAQMAGRVGLSIPRFSALYRQVFRASPIDDLVAERVEEARRLLELGYAPTEAALRVGFQDLPYFYRQFRRRCGMTPGQCRNRT